jgi:hypothetical protein
MKSKESKLIEAMENNEPANKVKELLRDYVVAHKRLRNPSKQDFIDYERIYIQSSNYIEDKKNGNT